MKVSPLKTKLIHAGDDLFQVIASTLPNLSERSVLALSSKLVSTCQGRFVPKKTEQKAEKFALVRQEADKYLEPNQSKYDIMLTIKDNWMFVNAGIDESNADNQYLLWPANPYQAAAKVWQYLRSHYGLKEVGVILTDSRSMPLNWGVVGHAIAYCGFKPLKSYINQPDLFGRLMKMEQLNIMQSLASAAVLEMGEGNESTPLALIEEITPIEWQDHSPTVEELESLKISLADDVYAPLLTSVKWRSRSNR